MSKRDWIEVGASLLGGAAIGAAIMYFFDPQLGDTRRADCRQATGQALSSAGERLGGAWETIAQKVKGAGESTADTASDWTDKARRFFSGAASGASDYASDAGKSARSYARRVRRAAGDWFDRDEGPSGGTIAGITAGAVGALALGAGLMFLLDPAQGRRRRALIRDKAVSAARRTQHYVQQKGRHWSNKAQGLAAETPSFTSQAPRRT
jgi:gas vesicle protein